MIQRAFRAKRAQRAAASAGRRQKTYARAGFPKARIGRQMGTFGKPGGKPKPVVGVKQHIDTHYIRSGDNVCYFGASVASTRDEILRLFCMTLVQHIAKRSGLVVSSWEALMPNYLQGAQHIEDGRLKGITIRFRRENENGIDEFSHIQTNSSTGTTYISFADSIASVIKTQAEDGYYPFEYQLVEVQGDGEQSYYIHNRFDEDIVHFSVNMLAKIQNVTPADVDNGMNMNDINANPLTGFLYDFKHETPRLAAAYEDGASGVAGSPFSAISKIGQQADGSETVYVNALRVNENPVGSLENSFQQPPPGAAVFDNLEGSKRIAMPPGGFMTLKRNYVVKANVKRFIAGLIKPSPGGGVVLAQMNLPILRKSFMVGLEPTMRTANNETVKINVNKETVQIMNFKRAQSPNSPAFVQVTTLA